MKKQLVLTLFFGFLFTIQVSSAQQVMPQSAVPQSAPVYQQPVYYQQSGAPQAPPATPTAPPAGYYYAPAAPVMVSIYSGTPIELETIYPLNGRKLSQGQTIDMRVKYDVVINGYKVISAGAPARVIVSSLEKNKMFGKAGEIQLLPQYVQTVDGQFLPVTGMPSNFEGKGRKGLAWGGVAAGALTGGIGFLALPFVKGKHAEVPVGTTLMCSVLGERIIPVVPNNR